MSLEVERKFVCDANTRKTLEEIGAVCLGQNHFQDQYFDTPDFHLTLKDTWLRRRKGCWELKCPTEAVPLADDNEEQSKAAALCSRYKEITNLAEIQLKVKEVMGHSLRERKTMKEKCCVTQGNPSVGGQGTSENLFSGEEDSWLRELNLNCFADFTTERCSFSLKEGVRVDLDQASFGFCVGEIEVLISEGEDMKDALDKIENTARRLGLTGNQRVQGKMDAYLRRYCPEHYAKLLDAHIL